MNAAVNGKDGVATIAVIGAGTMGSGIVQVAALAGHLVYLFDAPTEPRSARRIRSAIA